jgi:murein L,D-transpeptidase YafK
MRLLLSIALCFCLNFAALAEKTPLHADSILIEKNLHRLILIDKGKVVKAYRVGLGRGGKGQKMQQNDKKTPEGRYIIAGRVENSKFHRALRISYPNVLDVARAQAHGFEPGGDIMIHGLPKSVAWLGKAHQVADWTAGSITVTNPEIDEIWNAVADGTPVEIKP